MTRRRYFLKGLAAKATPRPPKVPKRPKSPDHTRKIVMATRRTGLGPVIHRTLSSRKAAQILGGQKGGLRISADGTAHRWTSETARKAAIKSWTKVRKFNKRIQARIGVVKPRPKLWREPLRQYYAENPTRGIHFMPWELGGPAWYRRVELVHLPGVEYRVISERAALQALGHLKSPRGYIPDAITPVPRRSDKRTA